MLFFFFVFFYNNYSSFEKNEKSVQELHFIYSFGKISTNNCLFAYLVCQEEKRSRWASWQKCQKDFRFLQNP
jgi:hypothetical protein